MIGWFDLNGGVVDLVAVAQELAGPVEDSMGVRMGMNLEVDADSVHS